MSLAFLNWASILLTLTAALPETGESNLSEAKSAVGKLRQEAARNRDQGEISYQFRVLEMDGLGWRSEWYEKLTPVTRQGTATLWTAPRHVAKPIAAKAARTIASPPRVTAAAHTAAHISTRATRDLISRVSWNGADTNTVRDSVREGTAATIVGRRIDQGVLAHLVVEETEIRKVHEVRLPSKEKAASATVPPPVSNPVPAPAAGKPSVPPHPAPASAATIETANILLVPEFDEQEIAGEWLIPKDGALLISMGVHTEVGLDGKPIVRERLLVLEAEVSAPVRAAALRDSESLSIPRPTPSLPSPAEAAPLPAPAPPSPRSPLPSPSTIPAPVAPPLPGGDGMPSPSAPSRTLPQGVHADGTPANLPPLPAEEPEDAAGSAEPHGSPQTRKKDHAVPMPEAKPKPVDKPAEKTVDAHATKASFQPIAPVSKVIGSKALTVPASLNRWVEKVRAGSFKVDPTSPRSRDPLGCCSEGECETE